MQNTIRFYYMFDEINISKINGQNYIKYQNKVYVFTEIINQEAIIEAYNITKDYDEYEKIVLNKDRSLFTPYNNKLYVLIARKDFNPYFPKLRILPSQGQYLLDRSNWSILWQEKIDYYEYQFKHIKGKYKSIDESFNYFIGLTENAISYLNYNIDQNIIKEKAICRRRMIKREYYNPLNIVVDNRMRDVGEYIKMSFWEEEYNIDAIKLLLNQIPDSNQNYILIYARLLYPSYYFDTYEQVVNNKEEEKSLIKIINRIDEYENFLNEIYIIMQNNSPSLIKIDWLKKIWVLFTHISNFFNFWDFINY